MRNVHRSIGLWLVLALALAACSGSASTDTTAATTAPSQAPSSTDAPSDTAGEAAAGGGFDTAGLEIGQVLYSSDSYQLAHARHVEEYAAELGMTVRTVDGQIDPAVQANAISDLISAGVDGILFQPVDPAAAVAPIEEAQRAGIPIATWAIKPAADVTTPYLDLNEYETTYEAGVAAAEAVAEIFDASPAIVAIDIPTVPLCSEMRMQGFIDGATSVDPNTKVVARPDGAGDRETSTNVMEDIIQSGAEFNIVTACNGEMALGALSALRAAGRGQAVDGVPSTEYVYTIDGSPSEIDELLDSSSPVMQTMALTPRENGRRFLDILVRMMAGEIAMDEAYEETTGSQNLPPDCDVVTDVLVNQFFSEAPEACAGG